MPDGVQTVVFRRGDAAAAHTELADILSVQEKLDAVVIDEDQDFAAVVGGAARMA